jgi:hypothetical protein
MMRIPSLESFSHGYFNEDFQTEKFSELRPAILVVAIFLMLRLGNQKGFRKVLLNE